MIDFDVIQLSHFEPQAEEHRQRWEKLMGRSILAVQGIQGINAAHAECCRRAATDWFLLLDGDCDPHPTFGSGLLQEVERELLTGVHSNAVVINFLALNPVTGMVSAHGGPKLIRRDPQWFEQLQLQDFCHSTRYQLSPVGRPFGVENYHLSPRRAFITAFKEAVNLLRLPGQVDGFRDPGPLDKPTMTSLWHWACIGADMGIGGYASMAGAAAAMRLWAKQELPTGHSFWQHFLERLDGHYNQYLESSGTLFVVQSLRAFNDAAIGAGVRFQQLDPQASAQYKRYNRTSAW